MGPHIERGAGNKGPKGEEGRPDSGREERAPHPQGGVEGKGAHGTVDDGRGEKRPSPAPGRPEDGALISLLNLKVDQPRVEGQ